MLRASPVRVLDDRDLSTVLAVLARNPIANVFVQSRVEAAGVQPWRLGAEMWGHVADGALTGLCYAGANLVPVEGDESALRAFADRARRQGRRCSSIVGPADMVATLWRQLEPGWGTARDIRPRQPLMVADAPAAVDQCVRVRERIDPEPDWIAAYERGYERFRRLYPAVKGLE